MNRFWRYLRGLDIVGDYRPRAFWQNLVIGPEILCPGCGLPLAEHARVVDGDEESPDGATYYFQCPGSFRLSVSDATPDAGTPADG